MKISYSQSMQKYIVSEVGTILSEHDDIDDAFKAAGLSCEDETGLYPSANEDDDDDFDFADLLEDAAA